MFYHALTFAGSLERALLNTKPVGQVFKHLPRDPARVNEMKNMCDRYSCIMYLILTKITLKMPLIIFLTLDFS